MTKSVLMVAPFYPPEGGGLERYVSHLATNLQERHDWRVVVATSGDQLHGRRIEEIDGVQIVRLSHSFTIFTARIGLNWIGSLSRLISQVEPDVVNVHLPVPGIADAAAVAAEGRPLVATYHAGGMAKGRPVADIAAGAYERFVGRSLLRRANWIVTSSDYVRDERLARYRGKSTTIHPGVDLDVFSPAPSLGADTVLFVGNLSRSQRHKGLNLLLSAVSHLVQDRPNLRLVIVGDGDDRGRYQSLARDMGIGEATEFRGRLAGPALVEAYREARVVAQPTFNDSFPMVLLEAMACGVPVVSTNVGGIPSLIEDGVDGYRIDAGQQRELSARLSSVLDDHELAARLGRAGRKKVQTNFSWSQVGESTDGLYRRLCGHNSKRVRRIAVVAPHFPPKIGGLERYAREVARGLEATGDYQALIITSNHTSGGVQHERVDGLAVVRMRTWLRLSNTPTSPLWLISMRRLLRDNHIDAVLAHTPVPFIADVALLSAGQRPVIVTYHAGSMVKGRTGVDCSIRLYEKMVLPFVLRRASRVVAVSETVRDRFLAPRGIRSEVVPPGVDVSLFCPTEAAIGRQDAPNPERVILFVGRLERSSAWKGVDVLIRAFRQVLDEVPDARLVLVGGGDAVEHLHDLAVSMGVDQALEFAGERHGRELVSEYRRASVVVLPSTTDAESFGITLIEAMACAKPVVGTRVGGIPGVIDDWEDGLIAEPKDPGDLARACLLLLREPELAIKMGRAGREKVLTGYSWNLRVDEYRRILEDFSLDTTETSP